VAEFCGGRCDGAVKKTVRGKLSRQRSCTGRK